MPRLRFIVVAMAIAAALLAVPSRPACAGCGLGPQILFSPAGGTPLPQNPTVFVFLRRHPSYDAADLGALSITDGAGRPLAFTRTDLASAHGARVARLEITAAAGPITVHASAGSQSGVATYVLGARPAPAAVATSIVEATYTYRSGCPPSNGFVLAISPKAPAYRVEVDGDTWIVPDQGATTPSPRLGTIMTGTIGCFDFTIPTGKPLALSITPLFTDGSEGDTRSEFCQSTGPLWSCQPDGHGGQHCVSHGPSCASNVTFTLRGAPTRQP
jgi:hypothetical protein